MECITCGSEHLANVLGHCSDRCSFVVGTHERNDYVPEDVGIGGGDDVEFEYCLTCGQIQGEFPISEEAINEAFNEEEL